ncbi:RraA family protein [Glacieibacterium sp.]|uniref:RraA family protein n=1 Tax=Glacieibacterium sp. TaxID=2860237 RepID=UPI003B00B3D9
MRSNWRLRGAALALAVAILPVAASAADGFFSPEQVIRYTAAWTGERFPDGRPKVPDDVLERMRSVTLEEAWATLRSAGFNHQYEDGWLSIFPDKILVGRALTSQWLPGRPDIQVILEKQGVADQRKGAMNAWPVDMLQKGDVYVSDHFGLKQDGPSIGDNVGNAIYARSGNGIVYDGAVRDINGLKELPNFVSFVRSYDPSHHFGAMATGARLNSTMVGINEPIRIGKATAMPGDVVLGRDGGVLFIPPQLAEKVVKLSENTRLRDTFGHLRLREGKYTAGQIDTRWTPAIEADFFAWLTANQNKLPVKPAAIKQIIRDHEAGIAYEG